VKSPFDDHYSKTSQKIAKLAVFFFAKFADHLGDAADVYIRFIFKKWVETYSGHFTHCCVILKGEAT